MKINNSRTAGFTLVEIMIVVAIIGLLAAIAIPNFVRARNTTQKHVCINNLRQIETAIHQWALENKKTSSDSASWTDLSPYIKNGEVKCPADPVGQYGSSAGVGLFAVGEAPNCSLHGTIQNPTP